MLGVSPAVVGYFVAVVYVGSMIGTVSAGGWVGRFGPIRVSQVGLLLCFIGLAAASSAYLPLVLAGALILGLGYGPATPASSVILARAAPPGMLALTFSIKQTGVPLGTAIAGAAVPSLVLLLGWQMAAVAIGLACAACAAALVALRPVYDATRDRAAPVSLRTAFAPLGLVVRDRRLLELSLVSFVYGGMQITLVAYLVTFLVESFALSLVLAGMVMAASQIASVAARHRVGPVRRPRRDAARDARPARRGHGSHCCHRARRGAALAALDALCVRDRLRGNGGRMEWSVPRRDRASRADGRYQRCDGRLCIFYIPRRGGDAAALSCCLQLDRFVWRDLRALRPAGPRGRFEIVRDRYNRAR